MALLNQRHSKTFVLWIMEFCAVSLLIKLSWVRKIIMLLIFFLLFLKLVVCWTALWRMIKILILVDKILLCFASLLWSFSSLIPQSITNYYNHGNFDRVSPLQKTKEKTNTLSCTFIKSVFEICSYIRPLRNKLTALTGDFSFFSLAFCWFWTYPF